MKARTLGYALAGVLSVSALALSAHAVTEMNGTGASAGTPFASFVPLLLCDNTTAHHYVNGAWGGFAAGSQHVWTCNRTTNSVGSMIIRYHGTRSSDGPNKTKAAFNGGGDHAVQLDINNLTGCSAVTTLTTGGRTYTEQTGCLNVATVSTFPTAYGFSDVRGSSFHQSGPPGSFINPISETGLTRVVAAITPFDIVLGNGVVQPNSAGTAVAGPVTALSRTQVEAIFSQASTFDWKQLGLATCAPTGGVMCAPGTAVDASSPIDLCLRNSGSGTKASFDEEVMKDATETAVGVPLNTTDVHGVFFGGSNGNVRDCIKGGGSGAGATLAHPNAAGYMETDQAFTAETSGTPGLYRVKLNGYTAYDVTKTERRCNIINGQHLYWSNQNMYRRSGANPMGDSVLQQLVVDFMTTAALTSTVAALPAGAFWIDEATMNVSKVADAGPILWKALPLPTSCQ